MIDKTVLCNHINLFIKNGLESVSKKKKLIKYHSCVECHIR